MYNVLCAEGNWSRYDFSVSQDDIQTHGWEKCKHDLGICNLPKKYITKCDSSGSRDGFESAAQTIGTYHIYLVNSAQKYLKCNSTYCLKEDNNTIQYFSFSYPFEVENSTYTRKQNRGEAIYS